MHRPGSLPEGHVLRTFLEEHGRIRDFLDRLREACVVGEPDPETAAALRAALHELTAHEALEEDVLFPILQEQGVREGCNIHVAEHGMLRNLRHRLRTALGRLEDSEPVGAGGLDALVEDFISSYRDHLEQEERTLYRAALELRDDAALWERVERGRDDHQDAERTT